MTKQNSTVRDTMYRNCLDAQTQQEIIDVETHTVNYHLKKVFDDSELEADSVIRNFRITAALSLPDNTLKSSCSAFVRFA